MAREPTHDVGITLVKRAVIVVNIVKVEDEIFV